MASYDGLATWYERYITRDVRWFTDACGSLVSDLLGPGRCLDIGCGGGIYIPPLVDLGWAVVGVDISADQLTVARERAGAVAEALVLADAAALPFADASFSAAVAALVPIPMWSELRRAGARGCPRRETRRHGHGSRRRPSCPSAFVGPHARRERGGQRARSSSGSRRAQGWSPNGKPAGIRARVGMHHLPLSGLADAFISAGLEIDRLEESRVVDPPLLLGIRATQARSVGEAKGAPCDTQVMSAIVAGRW